MRPVLCTSIPRGIGALGYTQQQPTEDRYLRKYGEFLDRLDVLLGGRGAEQLVFVELSTGAQNDLQCASDLARQMVTRFGMSKALGPGTLETGRAPLHLPETAPVSRPAYSERTSEVIDREVHELLLEAQERVAKTLRARCAELAEALLRVELVDRSALLAILSATHESAAA